MKRLVALLSMMVLATFGFGQSTQKNEYPQNPKVSERAGLDELTSRVTAGGRDWARISPGPIDRKNYIDDFIFDKMERDHIPHAPLSSDEEFLRRVFLDLTGRLTEPARVRTFLKDSDPAKRDKLIDGLTGTEFDPVAEQHPSSPFLDRWTLKKGGSKG